MTYKILEHELKAIDSLHNKRGVLHIVQGMSASFGAGCVLAMIGLFLLGERSTMGQLSAGAFAGFIVAAGAWSWKRRLKARLESLAHRIKLRGESGPPPPDSPNPGRRVKIG